MSGRKNPLDGRNRRAKKFTKSRLLATRISKNIGRPPTDRGELFGFRDSLLHMLASNWERIGWRLYRARSLKSLRKALSPLKGERSNSFWIALLLRESIEAATAVEIRKTAKKLSLELESGENIRDRYDLLIQKFDQADSASARLEDGAISPIFLEFTKRADQFEQCERELFSFQWRVADLEDQYLRQRAYFAQSELLKFKARGNAHDPRTFANAIAGLPRIGCRQSFTICQKTKSLTWPVLHYEVFEVIEKICLAHRNEASHILVETFRNEILRLPKGYLRTYFCENWRYLKLGIERVPVARLRTTVVPYLLATKFFNNLGRPRTHEELVLDDVERIEN